MQGNVNYPIGQLSIQPKTIHCEIDQIEKEYYGQLFTIASHAHGETFLESAVLAPVAVV
jgi:hypothetical protein